MTSKNGYFSKTVLGSSDFLENKKDVPKDIFGAYFVIKPQRTTLEERPDEELALLTKLNNVLISGDSTVRISNLAISFDDPNVILDLLNCSQNRKNAFFSFISKFKKQLNDELVSVYLSEFESCLFYEMLLWQKMKFTFVSTRD